MTDRQRDILALAVRAFAHTLSQIEQLAALGRETVERDTFLPLAAQQLGIRLGHDAAALPDSWREARAAVPWRSIRGLRNRLAHDYQIDFEILWSVFTEHVPEIRRVLATDFAWANDVFDRRDMSVDPSSRSAHSDDADE